ncbi:DUF4065 domain-containing protein [bacterium]|nr:DUF4065 domain-containing protein [bacterium]
MARITDVAAYIIRQYHAVTDENLDEMKLHKLLYLTQRETIAETGEPAFDEVFEGWKYGPVSRDVRDVYADGKIIVPTKEIPAELQYIVNNVVFEYGLLASWELSELSHKDSSWQNARKGLDPDENGDVPLNLDDIRADAAKIRPYDHVWDMYYDEFEDEA